MSEIKGQDIVILLKLASLQNDDGLYADDSASSDRYSVRNLEMELGISKSEVNASIQRSLGSGLARRSHASNHPQPHRRNLRDFLIHGLRFVFPAKPGAMTRGIPTGFAAPMLRHQLGSAGEHIHVWPHAEGHDLGQAVKPLFRSVPHAIMWDPKLYEYLAITDALRLGGRRERDVAAEAMSERLLSS